MKGYSNGSKNAERNTRDLQKGFNGSRERKGMMELKPTDFYRPGVSRKKNPTFTLIANDRECILKMNELFAREGYLAISDRRGEYKYYVDARKTPYHTKKIIFDLLHEDDKLRHEMKVHEEMRAEIVEDVLDELGLKSNLVGTQYILYAITNYPNPPEHYQPMSKKFYPQIAEVYDTSVRKVERCINYAIRKITPDENILSFLRQVYDLTEARIKEQKRRIAVAEAQNNYLTPSIESEGSPSPIIG